MGDQPGEKDGGWFSGQVVRMLVADIRAALESQLTDEEVSRGFQRASETLEARLELPQTALPESARDMALERQLSDLIIEMRKW